MTSRKLLTVDDVRKIVHTNILEEERFNEMLEEIMVGRVE